MMCVQGFVQNQARARNLQDVSVLPDLCTSHRRQLGVMLKNHQSLQDIHRRCAAAKAELSANLHARLRSLSLCHTLMCCTGTVNDPHHSGSCPIPARSFRDVLPNQSSQLIPKTHHNLNLDSSHIYVHSATIATCPDRKGSKSVSKEKHCILAS